MKGKLSQTGYHSILQHHTIPSGTWLLNQGFELMQDNNQKHASRFNQRYIKSQKEQHIFQLMSWPVQSADLNPIEMVWGKLDRKGRAKQPTTITHLWRLLMKSYKHHTIQQYRCSSYKVVMYIQKLHHFCNTSFPDDGPKSIRKYLGNN